MESRVERQQGGRGRRAAARAVATGRRGVAGLADVLERAQRAAGRRACSCRRGMPRPGGAATRRHAVTASGRTCKLCGSEMDEVDDVVEEAVEEALSQSCRVEICVGNADLDVLGRIGALLRY